MKTAILAMALLAVLTPATQAFEMDWLSLGSKMPRNTILEISGLDTATAHASARIEQADALDHCENFSPTRLEECTASLIKTEAGKIYTASADCTAGTITTVYGRSYTLAGYWQGDWGNGRSRWKDADGKSVPTNNAADGLSISQQWEVLCPTARPEIALSFSPGKATGNVVGIDHNGSFMWHDENSGVLYYEKPKASLKGTVPSGTVLFRGDPWSFEDDFVMAGTAYTFRKGCEPAPYKVTGRFDASGLPYKNPRIVLRGAAPIREKNGCAITGYSTTSGNAELIFELFYGDI